MGIPIYITLMLASKLHIQYIMQWQESYRTVVLYRTYANYRWESCIKLYGKTVFISQQGRDDIVH